MLCECGWGMVTSQEFRHVAYCPNPNCEHRGEFYEIPTFEAVTGKAFKK
jgi:hypothetical protein